MVAGPLRTSAQTQKQGEAMSGEAMSGEPASGCGHRDSETSML